MFKKICWFVIGMLVGMWMGYDSPVSVKDCNNICAEQFERMSC